MPDEGDVTRRDLLRGRLGKALQRAAASLGVREVSPVGPRREGSSVSAGSTTPSRRFALPIHRPPGALDEVAFLAGCTRCDACITACPAQAIAHAPLRFREAAGTPMIDPHAAACIMCEDAPCITACEPGVLKKDRPRKMGVAWIQPMDCLAHTGSFCTVCSERCPVAGAIEVAQGRPRVHEDVCTGCGVCAMVCPAPANAVVVMPLADRPRDAAGS